MNREKQNVPQLSLDERIRRVKAAYPLAEFIERVSHLSPSKRTESRWEFHSPLRGDDSTPSFSVYRNGGADDHWIDYGDGNRSGDIFDFLSAYQGITFYEALTQLENEAGYLPPPPPQREQPRREIKEIPMSRVITAAKFADFAVPYWESQHITRDTVHWNLMGTDREATLMGYQMGYKIEHGKYAGEWITGHCRRFTIPNVRPNSMTLEPYVVSVNSRRDDDSARQSLEDMKQMDYRKVEKVRDDLMRKREIAAQRWGNLIQDVTDSDLMNAIFGDKYLYWKPYNLAIFNLHIVYSWKGNGVCVPKPLDYVIVVEAEKCALALVDAGYPAIAIKPSSRLDLKKAIGHVPLIFWAYDSDDAGMKFTKAAIETARGTLLPIPQPFKDPTEVIVAERHDSWLSRHEIYPLENRKKLAAPEWLRSI